MREVPSVSPFRRLAGLAAGAALAASLAGCGHSQSCDFSDRPREDVWMAVVQASRAPRYPDWVVIENQVKADDSLRRVTVLRDLRRDVVEHGLDPRREEVEWRFAAQVSPGDPVTVTFSTPDWAVPGHFWQEADHFFAQVRMRLGEMGPVTPPPGDPMGGAPAAGARDPEAPGHMPPAPSGGGFASP
jgi:hypothetical protein